MILSPAHGPSGVVGSCKYSFSVSLEVMSLLFIMSACGFTSWGNTCASCLWWCYCVLCILPLWCMIWSDIISFASTLSFLQVTMLIGGGLFKYLNRYCRSFSLHLSHLVTYSPCLSQSQHCFPWCVSWPSCAVATDAISEDKSYFCIIIAVIFNIIFVVYLFQNGTFLTSIWSYRCLLQSEYGLESQYALKRKCIKETTV